MAKSVYVMRLSKKLKPHLVRVSRTGLVQTEFAAKAKDANDCVKNATKGKIGELTGAQIHAILVNCQDTHFKKGTQLDGPFIHNGPGADLARKKRRAGVS